MRTLSVLVAGLLALAAAACSNPGAPSGRSNTYVGTTYPATSFASGPTTGVLDDSEFSKYYSLFHIGNVFYYDSSTFNIDLVVAPISTQLIGIIDAKHKLLPTEAGIIYQGDWSENALPIFHALKAGKIPAFHGQTTATIIFNLLPEHMPRRLVYFNNMRSVGWAEVRPSRIPGHSEVTIPVMDGGLAELAVPRIIMQRKVRNKRGVETSVVVVVRLGTDTVQLPRITDGVYKDWPNTLIGKPSGTPGISYAAQRAMTYTPSGRVKYDGVLFPFITRR